MPSVENDEMKNIDLKINTKTKNDNILLDIKSKACLENLSNQKPLSKLDIKVDEVSTNNKNCDIVENNLIMPTVKENIVDLNDHLIVEDKIDNIIVNKKQKNNIFKRFKYK